MRGMLRSFLIVQIRTSSYFPLRVELLLDWLYSFLTVEEQDRLTGWHLGVSL